MHYLPVYYILPFWGLLIPPPPMVGKKMPVRKLSVKPVLYLELFVRSPCKILSLCRLFNTEAAGRWVANWQQWRTLGRFPREHPNVWLSCPKLARLQNTPQFICISLNNNSDYCFSVHFTKDSDTSRGRCREFCNRSPKFYTLK